MRELKFRFFDGEKMVYQPDINLAYAIASNNLGEAPGLMQYTGLKDKSGKEIYEGDILNIGENGYAVPCEVVFNDGCFCIVPQWDKDKYIPLKEYCNKVFNNCVEIIGNIYENPELTKEN